MAVGLNLFTSRMGERQQALTACLSALHPALHTTAAALQACCTASEDAQDMAPVLLAAQNDLAALPVRSLPACLTGVTVSGMEAYLTVAIDMC